MNFRLFARPAAIALSAGAMYSQCEPAISKKEFKPFKLEKIENLTHNTKLFRLKLPKQDDTMGMTCAGMLMVQGEGKDGKRIARPYTPTTRDSSTQGHFDLVIKNYPDGNVSSYMFGREVGDEVMVKGCFTKKQITPNMKKRMGFIAGGSGLTPMLQVIEELLESPDDETELSLLFCNQCPEDIFLSDRIDALAAKFPRFKAYYCVDKADESWAGLTGYVTEEMFGKIMPGPSEDALIFVCGPPPMYKAICGGKKFTKGKPPSQGEVGGFMKSMGYTEDMVFKF